MVISFSDSYFKRKLIWGKNNIMLNFEEKKVLIEFIDGFELYEIFMGCINVYYLVSKRDKKIIVKYFYLNGNVFVYVLFLEVELFDK